jgi:hypothetical protein
VFDGDWTGRMLSMPAAVVSSTLDGPVAGFDATALVDRLQVTIFPVITGQRGEEPIFQGAADFDLELLESRTLDGRTQELVCRPSLD